jgi:hypothetical protein
VAVLPSLLESAALILPAVPTPSIAGKPTLRAYPVGTELCGGCYLKIPCPIKICRTGTTMEKTEETVVHLARALGAEPYLHPKVVSFLHLANSNITSRRD